MIVEWSLLAKARLKEIGGYISQENPKAARNVVNRIVNEGNGLDAFANRGRVGSVLGTMEIVFTDIPYNIVYVLKDDKVLIVTIIHQSQQSPALNNDEKTPLDLLQ